MIEAHTLDAWTRTEDRSSIWFRDLMILGGLAAPLFLWLGGLAAVLAGEALVERTRSRSYAGLRLARRGLEIFVLAFLFRLQAFIVSPGSKPVALLRVDILNVMGPAIAVAALVWILVPRRAVSVTVFGAIALAIAMATPIVRIARWVDALPLLLQWYLRPAGEHTTFTLFPWSGFVFGGAAVGSLLAQAAPERETRLNLALATAGAGLILVAFYSRTLPSIYQASSFWTSSPTYFALRAGVLMAIVAGAYGLLWLMPAAALRPLERLGQSSLFIYWIHIELVYGYATWPIHAKLWLWQVVIAYIAFTALMYQALPLRDYVLAAWQLGRRRRSVPAPSP